jgi:hypothetical protein
MRRFSLAAGAAFIMLLIGMEAAFAQAGMPFVGYTDGCFTTSPGCTTPNNTPAFQTDTATGLTYVNATFSGTTFSDGRRSLGGNPTGPNAQNFNNFGSFTLSPAATGPNVVTFRLLVTFTSPDQLPAGSILVDGTAVISNGGDDNGGAFVEWQNSSYGNGCNFGVVCAVVNFTDQLGSGTFQFFLYPVAVEPGQTAEITGRFFVNTFTPNPNPPLTFTPTATSTATATATATVTETSTPTPSQTVTVTLIPTHSSTATQTLTSTHTALASNTPTPTITVTATSNAIFTPTAIPQPNVVSVTAACRQVDNPTGVSSWTNPQNATPNDGGLFATNGIAGFETEYILCDNLGLGQLLPTNATITGIEVLVDRRASATLRAKDTHVHLISPGPNPAAPDGSLTAAERGGGDIPTTFTVGSFGGFGELWGESWTAAELSDPDFGATYAVRRTSTSPVTVDVRSIQVRVYYSV